MYFRMKVIIFKYITKIFSPFLNLTGDVFVTFNHISLKTKLYTDLAF